MFLHLLNEAQQKAFLALAQQFIDADRNLAEAERNLLGLMYAETGVDLDEELPQGDVETLLQAFDTRQAKAAAMLELIGIGHADEEFHPDENAFIRRVAAGLSIPEGEVRAMEDWVQRQLTLAREVEKFWADWE